MITWQTEKGKVNGYLALPEGGQGHGVLVLHAWWGLTDFIQGLCDRLATAGFVALAPDLYGNGATAETIAEAEQLIQDEDYEGIQAIASSAVHFLTNHAADQGQGIGTVAFSFGAPYSLLLATALTPADIKAVVLFYGNYPGLDYSKARAAFLGHFAENDPYEDPEGIELTRTAINNAGLEGMFYIYPETGHWFFENNRPDAYDPEAAELAWERTITFLQAQLNQ